MATPAQIILQARAEPSGIDDGIVRTCRGINDLSPAFFGHVQGSRPVTTLAVNAFGHPQVMIKGFFSGHGVGVVALDALRLDRSAKPSVVPVFVTRREIPATFLGIIRHGQLAKQAVSPTQMAVGMLSRAHHHVNTLQALVHGVSPLVQPKLSNEQSPVLTKSLVGHFQNRVVDQGRRTFPRGPRMFGSQAPGTTHARFHVGIVNLGMAVSANFFAYVGRLALDVSKASAQCTIFLKVTS